MLTNKSGAAGAVTEEAFYGAFEDVPPAQFDSARDLVSIMQDMNSILSDPNNDWEKRIEALKKLRSLMVSQADEYDDFFVELRNLEVPFQLAVKDLRSQVVREACITIGYLAFKLGRKLDHFAETVFHALINLIKSSTKVMSTSGVLACRFIFKHTHSPKLIPVVTSNLNSKSKEIRRASCELLWLMLKDWPTSALDKNSKSLQQSIKTGLSDADSETRAFARKAYWIFADHFKDLADLLYQSLDNAKQRQLRGELSQSSSSSSLAALGGGQAALTIAAASSHAAATQPFRTSRASQENVFTAGSRVPRPAPTSVLNKGIPGGRSTSDIDAGAAKRAAQRYGLHTAMNSRPKPVIAPQQSHLQHLNSLPRSGGQPSSANRKPSLKFTFCSPVVEEKHATPSTVTTRRRRTPMSSSVSQPTSRSNSPSRIAIPSSSHRKGSRPPLAIAPYNFPSLSRETSPTRSSGYGRRSSDGRASARGVCDMSLLSDFDTPAARRFSREKSEDMADDASSLGSGHSGVAADGLAGMDVEIQDALRRCCSVQPQERKDGLLTLQRLYRAGRRLSRQDVKRICEMFMRLFVDPQLKTFTILLDTLNDFITSYRGELNDYLYFLLVRLFARIGSESLASVQTKLARTLDVVRDNFSPHLQFHNVVRFLNDPTQTPGVKVKMALLKYFSDVLPLTDSGDLRNTPETRQAVFKFVQWAADPRNVDLRRPSQQVLASLLNLNAPEFNAIVSTFNRSAQDIVHRLLQSQLQKQAGDVSSSGNKSSSNYYGASGGPGQHQNVDMENVYRSLRKTSEEIRCYTTKDLTVPLSSAVKNAGAAGDANHVNGSNDSGIVDYADQFARGDGDTLACKLMDALDLNAEYDEQEETIAEILTELSNHNTRPVERRKAMAVLKSITRDGTFTLWDEHFKAILLILLETLGDNDYMIRMHALRTLREICLCQAARFRDYAELTLLKVLEAHKDAERDVVRIAEECATVLATHLPPSLCLRLFLPIVRAAGSGSAAENGDGGPEIPVLLAAIKMTSRVVEQLNADECQQLLPEMVPCILSCYDHKESSIRKASVLCLVAIHNSAGIDWVEPFLEGLSSNKIKLFHMYIKKTQSPSPST